jgi:hypothetical protein
MRVHVKARKILSFALSLTIAFPANAARSPRPPITICEKAVSRETRSLADMRPASVKIENNLNELLKQAGLLPSPPDWTESIQKYLIPSLQAPHQNLVVTIAGGTNVGKSLIFNSLRTLNSVEPEIHSNEPSSISFNADSTARPVLMFSADLFDENGNFDIRFPRTERWRSIDQVKVPGIPLVYPTKNFFRHIIFIDTPAFTEIAKGNEPQEFIDLAARSDILIYVFSNANYSDRRNLEALRQTLQRVGPRDLILIYNVNAAIPQTIAEEHVDYVSRYLQNATEASREDPAPRVIGSYQMVHSERVAAGEENANLIPIGGAMPFSELLNILDSNFFLQRRQALNFTLKHILERAKETFADVHREESELDLTERILMSYLDHLISETTKDVPYDRLGAELEETWNKQSPGLSGFAHWVANPLMMAGVTARSTSRRMEALDEVEHSMENIANTIVAEFRLAIAEKIIKIPSEDPVSHDIIEAVDQFRERFGIHGDRAPMYKIADQTLEVHLPIDSPGLKLYLDDYIRRNWPASIAQIKQASKESFANLALEIQTKLGELVQKQPFHARAAQSLYTGLAVCSVIAAIAYIAYQGRRVVEVESIVALISAHLLARLFVRLQHRSLNQSWDGLISDWLSERQHPRLREIIATHVRFRPSSQKLGVEFENVRRAIDQLDASGIVLKEPDE